MSALFEKSYSIFKQSKQSILVGRNSKLTLQDAKLLAKKAVPVALNREAYSVIEESYNFLKQGVDGRDAIYGINTQFGDQVNILEPYLKNALQPEAYYDSINSRQINLIRSHYCGLGNIISPDIIKVTIMLRAHCLGQGYSGVRLKTIKTMLECLNCGIVPLVRCYGSIGASGDLIPLAMIAAGITGQDVEVFYRGERMKADKAITMAGVEKIIPESRDGLAMINGTSFMSAISSLALYNLRRLFRQMLCAIAMSLESMLVIESSYHSKVHKLKHHQGEIDVNTFLLSFWKGSRLLLDLEELRDANRNTNGNINEEIKRVQDFYSLRAVSQGFGPFYENIERSVLWIEEEMNSINDNPIIDSQDKKIFHSANFMGYYVTTACDMLKMDIAQASTWVHALLANMVHPRKSYQLPTNLVPDPSQQNGFRPLQLLAAALAVQNRKLAQAHQSFMLPTEGDNQDVNSLGTHAALDFQEAVCNLERLTAILLLASAQALEFRNIDLASEESQKIHKTLRQYSKTLTYCRPMTEDIHSVIHLLEEEMI